MQIGTQPSAASQPLLPMPIDAQPPAELVSGNGAPDELQQAFHDFVGQTFFGELIKAFRSTQQPSAYFHGGRAEEIFQGQFDQELSRQLSDASADQVADPMFELFMLKRTR